MVHFFPLEQRQIRALFELRRQSSIPALSLDIEVFNSLIKVHLCIPIPYGKGWLYILHPRLWEQELIDAYLYPDRASREYQLILDNMNLWNLDEGYLHPEFILIYAQWLTEHKKEI